MALLSHPERPRSNPLHESHMQWEAAAHNTVRNQIGIVLEQHFPELGQVDSTPVDCAEFAIASPSWGRPIHHWAKPAGDPSAAVVSWCWEAPCITEPDAYCLNGTSPFVEAQTSPNDIPIATAYSEFANYIGTDKDPEAIKFITPYVEKGWLTEFGIFDDCVAYAGGPPILSKLVETTRTKLNPNIGETITNNPIILDPKQRGIKDITKRTRMSILKNIIDATSGSMDAIRAGHAEFDETRNSKKDSDMDHFILDVVDAVWFTQPSRGEQVSVCQVEWSMVAMVA